jgi:hypothetical protein
VQDWNLSLSLEYLFLNVELMDGGKVIKTTFSPAFQEIAMKFFSLMHNVTYYL